MVLALLLLAAAPQSAMAQPGASRATAATSVTLNPRAVEFIERDPAVEAWAMATFDANRDGWLTSFEAQSALEAFREIADANRDGRLTVSEYNDGVTLVSVRY